MAVLFGARQRHHADGSQLCVLAGLLTLGCHLQAFLSSMLHNALTLHCAEGEGVPHGKLASTRQPLLAAMHQAVT